MGNANGGLPDASVRCMGRDSGPSDFAVLATLVVTPQVSRAKDESGPGIIGVSMGFVGLLRGVCSALMWRAF